MMRLFTRLMAVAAATLGVAGSASADIILDNFQTAISNGAAGSSYAITSLNPSGVTFNNATVLPNNFSRSLTLNVTTPVAPTNFNLTGSLGGGNFIFQLGSAVVGNAHLAYVDAFNLAGITGITLSFSDSDGGTGPSMPVTVTVKNGATTLVSVTQQRGGPGTVFVPLAGLGPTATEVDVDLNLGNAQNPAQADADFTMTNITLVTTNPVPAPPAVFLVGAAMPVLAVRRWLAKRKAVAAA